MTVETPAFFMAAYLRYRSPGTGTNGTVATSCEQPTWIFAPSDEPACMAASATRSNAIAGPVKDSQ